VIRLIRLNEELIDGVLMSEIKILDLIPIIYTEGIKEGLKDREKLAEEIREKTAGRVKLEMEFLDMGTASIESSYDEALNQPYILKKVKEAEERGYSAVVIDCFGDPGLNAARELVKIPVIGANQSACHLAMQIAPTFSIINILPELEPLIRELALKYGYLDFLASVVTINIPVLELEKDPDKSAETIANGIETAVKRDRAHAVVFGCTGMSSLLDLVKQKVANKGIDVPIIEPLRTAVWTAVMFSLMGISHSKSAYRPPREKLRKVPY